MWAGSRNPPRLPLRLSEKKISPTWEYGMNCKSMLITKNNKLNAGGIYENAVAQELHSKGFNLYYYNSNRLGERDLPPGAYHKSWRPSASYCRNLWSWLSMTRFFRIARWMSIRSKESLRSFCSGSSL